ncbi:MAG: transglutaminase-like domain-containing protein [Candidatus Njordarchaeales archaeon]
MFAVVGVLVVLLAVESALYLELQGNYNALKVEHSKLLNDYSLLQGRYSELQSDFSRLQENYNSLKSAYSNLQSNYWSLSQEYAKLKSDYDLLKGDYEFFMETYSWIVREVNRRLGNDWELYRELITPNDPEVQSLVISITGGWSGFGNDWNEFWSEIKEMYDWVVNNIEYRYDGLYPELPEIPGQSILWEEDMWQLPSETLELRKGDCDDMALLLCSMIRCYVKQVYDVYVIIVHSKDWGHAAVVIPVQGGKICIVDPAGHYYTKTWWGTITQKDVDEEIYNWFNHLGGKNTRVVRVFNEDEKVEFTSTEDFIIWIYNTTMVG